MTSLQLKHLHAVLSKCTFKSLGGDLFLPMLEAFGEIAISAKEIEELEISAAEKLGLEVIGGHVKAPTQELHSSFISALDRIGNKEIDIKLPTLSTDKFVQFSDENPSLTTADLLLIKKLFVK